MQKILTILCAGFLLCVNINAQKTKPVPTQTASTSTPAPDSGSEKPRRMIFRATKDQINTAQKMLKEKGLYDGEPIGKLDDATRESLRKYQAANAVKATGTLNRLTLEKMGIALTDNQKAMPIPPEKPLKEKSADGTKKRGAVFRATKDQITEAQTKMKAKGMYSGEMTGKLDDETRTALRKFQETNGVKVTGTLNAVTLEKMSIALTDKQKELAAAKPTN